MIAAAGAAVTLIAACGSAQRHPAASARVTPATLLAQTVGSADTLQSGRIDMTLALTLDGVKELGGKPVTLELSGPFARGSGGRVSTDLALALSAGTSHVTAGLDIVDGVTYVGLGGQFYKLGAAPGAGATGMTGASGAMGWLGGLDPSGWLRSPHIVGNAVIGGVSTRHLHALVDVPTVLDDLAKLLGPVLGATGASGATGSTGATGPVTQVLMMLESAITSASVDLYTGVTDHIPRRAQLAIAFTVPQIAADALGGLTGGSLDLDTTLTELGQTESVAAPADAQPASKLVNGVLALESQFGSLAPFVKQFGSLVPAALHGSPAILGG